MIKLCGMTRMQDIEYVNEFKPDYMGMILSPGFKRSITKELAIQLASKLDCTIKKVGVFVDEQPENIFLIANAVGLDVIQLHGSENAGCISRIKQLGIPVWKAVRVRSADDIGNAYGLGADCLLLDSYVKGIVGGTGKTADWELIRNTQIDVPFFLAGGINAANIKEALTISPHIDISGGIETDGFKDRNKIKEIMNIYRKENSAKQAQK